jgi:hypothetical protein
LSRSSCRCGDDEEYRRLLSTLEALLPLRKASGLADPFMAGRILAASEGLLGEIIAIVLRSAVMAVNTGAEAILPDMIEDSGFIRPSARRNVSA